MDVLKVVLVVILLLSSLVLIAAVLMQAGKSAGLSGTITGGAETFFGKNKAKSYEGKLVLATKITATVVFVVSLGFAIIARFAS